MLKCRNFAHRNGFVSNIGWTHYILLKLITILQSNLHVSNLLRKTANCVIIENLKSVTRI